MARDYIEIGGAPCEEECVQLDQNKPYYPEMLKECARFLQLIRRHLGPEPMGAQLGIKRFEYDYGPYCEVVCFFDEDNEVAMAYAFKCEAEAPRRWDKEAVA